MQDTTTAEMLCLQDAPPAADAEAEGEELATEEDAEGGQGLDLSMAKKKKKKKPKARTDEEFGAMVEDVESMPAEGMSLLPIFRLAAHSRLTCGACSVSCLLSEWFPDASPSHDEHHLHAIHSHHLPRLKDTVWALPIGDG